MAETDVGNITTTGLNTGVDDFSVSRKVIDSAEQDENFYDNPHWSEYLGYYKQVPELKKAIDALATWTAGKGWTADATTKVMLEDINGWGEDCFQSILQNLLIVKKVNGDSYAEIVRSDEGTLINLKPLNPQNMRIVVGKDGLIIRYEYRTIGKTEEFDTWEIFHLSNDRIANEMHGTSVVEACKWVIDARNEVMSDWRKMLHRNLIGVRIIEVDEDDPDKLTTLKNAWKDAINKGEVLVLPKGTATFPPTNTQNPEAWIKYLENFFYQAVGIPKIILGGSQEFTEASSKIGYLTFEQIYMTEQRLLESDIWNQLALRITFERPVSLKEAVTESEEKNTGQVGFQENELTPSTRRNE